ncbi:unnamed protein product [Soboliphyme baturini]|uniref:DNA primase small subunit n=1 Tax=Soboliphyme baturini TaxID=241478 RepID=A0A183IMP2_9BILA|nr:unnamed protein product [Soboliphyme baturini]
MLQLAYPRLDINVTKGVNHLLKSPFCVHPKTGCVSVPIDYASRGDFDVENVPRIEAEFFLMRCSNERRIAKVLKSCKFSVHRNSETFGLCIRLKVMVSTRICATHN